MKQLDSEVIRTMIAECVKNRPGTPITTFYKWVPDGAYDDQGSCTRLFIHAGFAYLMASKMWVESDGRDRLPEWMQVEWGSYPDLPAKP